MEDKRSFTSSVLEISQMNLFQRAIYQNLSSFIHYLLIEHKVSGYPSTKLLSRNLDPRTLLLSLPNDSTDETFCLRLAIQNLNHSLFELFWSHFDFLYDERHLMILTRFLLFLGPS